jgi:hypothetical protein
MTRDGEEPKSQKKKETPALKGGEKNKREENEEVSRRKRPQVGGGGNREAEEAEAGAAGLDSSCDPGGTVTVILVSGLLVGDACGGFDDKGDKECRWPDDWLAPPVEDCDCASLAFRLV